VIGTTKTCSKCGEVKDLSCFDRKRKDRTALRTRCKECLLELEKFSSLSYAEKTHIHNKRGYAKNREGRLGKRKKQHAENPDKFRLNSMRYGAKKNGQAPVVITEDELRAYRQSHSGICDFERCKKSVEHIDHDHNTGKFRGLLCQDHNHLLGNAHDSIEELEDAIHYLSRASA
jgi:hypothetical protein